MSKRRISPNEFMSRFLEVVNSVKWKARLSEVWHNNGVFTALMIGRYQKDSTCMKEIAEALDLRCWLEDYTLDLVMYDEKDAEHFKENTFYAKYYAVVLEHENFIGGPKEKGGSFEEMNKLTKFNSPLKVLITYPNSEDDGRLFLEKYSKILEYADVFDDFSTHRKHLVIFGYLFQKGNPSWTFHEYRNGEFLAMSSR